MKSMQLTTTLFLLVFQFGLNAQYNVGHTTITFNDPARSGGFGSGGGPGRQIQTEIYYPALSTGDDVACAADSFPVIVFGHGFAMAWDAYANIWEHYASKGYILAFPRTEGGLIPGPSHGDFAEDLKIVVSRMWLENTNNGSILENHIRQAAAIIGHSMGGGAAALASSGNTFIRTYVGLAPAETNPSAETAASGITVPSLIFSGSQDGVTPAVDHHLPIYDAITASCKNFVSIHGGAHCYFANSNFNCDFGEGSASSGISITRQEQQDRTFAILDEWLKYTLWNDCEGLDESLLIASGNASFYSSQSTCSPIGNVTIIESAGVLTSSMAGIAYQWYHNGAEISGANSISFTPSVNGDYSVEVTHPSTCKLLSDPYTVSTLDVEDLAIIDYVLYPNPANEYVIVSGTDGEFNYLILAADGRIVHEGISTGIIETHQLISGVYFVHINFQTHRLIVDKR